MQDIKKSLGLEYVKCTLYELFKRLSPKRWLENFEKLYQVQNEKVKLRKKNILIIPPTSAICWYFSYKRIK